MIAGFVWWSRNREMGSPHACASVGRSLRHPHARFILPPTPPTARAAPRYKRCQCLREKSQPQARDYQQRAVGPRPSECRRRRTKQATPVGARRRLLARNPHLASGVRRIAMDEVRRFYRDSVRRPDGKGGAVSVQQRFGSALIRSGGPRPPFPLADTRLRLRSRAGREAVVSQGGAFNRGRWTGGCLDRRPGGGVSGARGIPGRRFSAEGKRRFHRDALATTGTICTQASR